MIKHTVFCLACFEVNVFLSLFKKCFSIGIPLSLTFCVRRFDVILDNTGADTEQWAMSLLKPWSGAKYVTLVTPLLLNTDSMGLLDGTFHSGITLNTKAIQVNMRKVLLIKILNQTVKYCISLCRYLCTLLILTCICCIANIMWSTDAPYWNI